jgi:hypothetical protein
MSFHFNNKFTLYPDSYESSQKGRCCYKKQKRIPTKLRLLFRFAVFFEKGRYCRNLNLTGLAIVGCKNPRDKIPESGCGGFFYLFSITCFSCFSRPYGMPMFGRKTLNRWSWLTACLRHAYKMVISTFISQHCRRKDRNFHTNKKNFLDAPFEHSNFFAKFHEFVRPQIRLCFVGLKRTNFKFQFVTGNMIDGRHKAEFPFVAFRLVVGRVPCADKLPYKRLAGVRIPLASV